MISAVAASLAAVYAARLSAVLPVGASSPVNPSNAVFACVKASLLAGSFSVAAASASFAFSSSTLANATVASAFVALLALAFSTSSAAFALACVRSA